MPAWQIQGPTRGTAKSWRELYPELGAKVERVNAPKGRGIAWEGTEIWAWRDRPGDIAGLLAANVERYPEREAYVFHPGGQRLTWRQVGEQVQRVAARLRREHGLRKGDRLGLLTLGCPQYVIAYLATVSLGAIAVPVNLGLTAEGLAAQIDKVKARLLVVSPEIWAGKLDAVRSRLSSVEAVFITGDQAVTGMPALCTTRPRRCRSARVRGHRRMGCVRHLLHLGHHRRAQGDDGDAHQRHRLRDEHHARGQGLER